MLVIWRSTFGIASRGRLSVLIFHRVVREADPLLPSEPSAAEFDALIAHVKARFTILPLREAVHRLQGESLPDRALAITFDDGYADNVEIAAPILQRHGVSATVFVASGYLDGACMFNDVVIHAFRHAVGGELDLSDLGFGRHALASADMRTAGIDKVLEQIKYRSIEERNAKAAAILRIARVAPPAPMMMSRSAVQRLRSFGIEVGAHTVHHPILTAIPAHEARWEISESKRALEELVDGPVSLFAYPNGKPGRDYDREHVEMVREAGFVAAVSGAWGAASRASDVFQLPRFTPWTRRPLKFDLLMLRNLRQGLEQRAA
jgi:peptidoglycan/xylan/chitin deacetylase (PgdA/CDA1 family)